MVLLRKRLIKLVEGWNKAAMQKLIPSQLLKVLGEAALDEIPSTLLPDLRPIILPHLPREAPHIAAVLDKASAMCKSVKNASDVVLQVCSEVWIRQVFTVLCTEFL